MSTGHRRVRAPRSTFPTGVKAPNTLEYFIDQETRITDTIVPCGYATEDTDVALLDKNGEEVGSGQIGEIAIKSRYLSPGYWRKPDLTQAKFLRDSTAGDEQFYLTGDIGRMLPDGCLVHLGRKDFQVKVRGHRIEVTEIETALVRLDSVKEAVVVAHRDQSGEHRLVAYLVPANTPDASSLTLRGMLSGRLPDYMIPSAFVMIDAMPLTPVGKVDRGALSLHGGPLPTRKSSFIAPRNPAEQIVAKIWTEVLGVEQVGIYDNFFELGGHSLKANQVIARIRTALRVDLPVVCLFTAPTVIELGQASERILRFQPPDVSQTKS